jgi:hypothetical protein
MPILPGKFSMFHRAFFSSILASILLFSFSVVAQDSVPPRGSDERATAASRKKAIDLLESVASQVGSLRSAENRARLRSNIAALLWEHDEKHSRGLFALVEEDIRAGFGDIDSKDPGNHTLRVFLQLRRDTVDRIVDHDPVLALEFLRSTRPPFASDQYQLNDSEKNLELHLARQIAAKNPQLALKLGRDSLAKGFSPDLLSVLVRLQKDRKAWLSFYQAIVTKLKSANLEEESGAIEVALNLARWFQPPLADEQVYRELIDILLASAVSNECAAVPDEDDWGICFHIGSVYSILEKYDALRAAPLRGWAERGQHYGSQPPQVREVIESGTVEEILALAPKYPEMQAQIYWSAMTKAEAAGDVALARKIASESPDESQRDYMVRQLDRSQMMKSLTAEELAAIQQDLNRLGSDAERVRAFIYIASQIGEKDRKAALGFLSQAGQLIDLTKSGKNRLEGQILLAMQYSAFKSERGFAIMESILPKLNELVSAAAVLDEFENSYLRDGEWNMTGEGTVGALLTTLAHNAGYFAKMDFDRSVTLASQFERAELRLMAHQKIAQSVLSNQPIPGAHILRFQRLY